MINISIMVVGIINSQNEINQMCSYVYYLIPGYLKRLTVGIVANCQIAKLHSLPTFLIMVC